MIITDRPDGSEFGNPIGVQHERTVENRYYEIDRVEDAREAIADFVVVRDANDSTLEQYIGAKLQPHSHVRALWAGRIRDYCALFKAAVRSCVEVERIGTAIDSARKIGDLLNRSQESVFVSSVEFMKEPESAALRIRSQVRLKFAFADRLSCEGVHALQPAPFSIIKFPLAGTNREHDAVVIGLAAGQCPRDVIESAPGVVNAVPNDQAPLLERGLSLDLKLEEVANLVSIIFLDDGIGFRIREFAQLHVKQVRMFLAAPRFASRFL